MGFRCEKKKKAKKNSWKIPQENSTSTWFSYSNMYTILNKSFCFCFLIIVYGHGEQVCELTFVLLYICMYIDGKIDNIDVRTVKIFKLLFPIQARSWTFCEGINWHFFAYLHTLNEYFWLAESPQWDIVLINNLFIVSLRAEQQSSWWLIKYLKPYNFRIVHIMEW